MDIVERCEGGVGLLLYLGGQELVEGRARGGAVAWPPFFVNLSVQMRDANKVQKG